MNFPILKQNFNMIMNEEEINEEDDEVLVYADFESLLLPNELDNDNLDIKVIAVETDSPMIQINGKIYQGTYDDAMGTNLLFEEDQNTPSLDPVYDIIPSTMYKFSYKTNKVLSMKRIFVENTEDKVEVNEEEISDELKARMKVKISYQEALEMLLTAGKKPPRHIDKNDTEVFRGGILRTSLDNIDVSTIISTHEEQASSSGQQAEHEDKCGRSDDTQKKWKRICLPFIPKLYRS